MRHDLSQPHGNWSRIPVRKRNHANPIVQEEYRQKDRCNSRFVLRAALLSITRATWMLEGVRIIVLNPDVPVSPMQEWSYDLAMNMAGYLVHDRPISSKGREDAHCRFAMDELVKRQFQSSIVLGRVIGLQLSPGVVAEERIRSLYLTITTDFDRVEFNTDQSENRNAADYLDMDDFNVCHECLVRRSLVFKESRQ